MRHCLVLLFLMAALLSPALHAQDVSPDRELLEKAKLELFDRHWNSALKHLNTLLEDYSDSRHYNLALFYKGKCLEELKRTEAALRTYTRYLDRSKNKNLKEESTIAIIDLNYRLYKEGEKERLDVIIGFLRSDVRMVRYYAAFKLSYASEKNMARKAVRVLNKVIANEDDDELVDRAKLALMRIDPALLKQTSPKRNMENKMLHIRSIEKSTGKETFSVSIPFSLAKLALEAIPEKERKQLAAEGYPVEKLLETLVKSPEIIRIEVEDMILKIWVE